jgi:hypothetical protein
MARDGKRFGRTRVRPASGRTKGQMDSLQDCGNLELDWKNRAWRWHSSPLKSAFVSCPSSEAAARFPPEAGRRAMAHRPSAGAAAKAQSHRPPTRQPTAHSNQALRSDWRKAFDRSRALIGSPLLQQAVIGVSKGAQFGPGIRRSRRGAGQRTDSSAKPERAIAFSATSPHGGGPGETDRIESGQNSVPGLSDESLDCEIGIHSLSILSL